MPTLDDARTALATAVTTAGLSCLPYPVDNPSPPIAWVDSVVIDFTGGLAVNYFCLPGTATSTIVSIAQRNDLPGATKFLEDLIPPTLEELNAVPGLRVVSSSSGILNVGGQELPAVTVTVQFPT